MTDDERIARAMGWEYRGRCWEGDDGHEYCANFWQHPKQGLKPKMPDYHTDSTRLSEMLNWLAERYGFVIERIESQGGFSGCWIVALYLRDSQVYVEDDDENAELQQAVARCVLWALDQEQSE